MARILNVPNESLGINNATVYSLLSKKYSEYFGFTEAEIDEVLEKTNLKDKAEEIKQCYNGYQADYTVVYNPWSIANCIKQNGMIESYWINANDTQSIKDLFKRSPLGIKENFELLLEGKSIKRFINKDIVLHDFNNDVSSVWTFLLMSGYLKSVCISNTDQGVLATLEIPNKEVFDFYRQMSEEWLSKETLTKIGIPFCSNREEKSIINILPKQIQ